MRILSRTKLPRSRFLPLIDFVLGALGYQAKVAQALVKLPASHRAASGPVTGPCLCRTLCSSSFLLRASISRPPLSGGLRPRTICEARPMPTKPRRANSAGRASSRTLTARTGAPNADIVKFSSSTFTACFPNVSHWIKLYRRPKRKLRQTRCSSGRSGLQLILVSIILAESVLPP